MATVETQGDEILDICIPCLGRVFPDVKQVNNLFLLLALVAL